MSLKALESVEIVELFLPTLFLEVDDSLTLFPGGDDSPTLFLEGGESELSPEDFGFWGAV